MEISLIVVGMNHLKYLKVLFSSIHGVGRPKCSFEVIYVDNCSKDGSVEFLNEFYPDTKIIVNTTPLGFASNNNLGARIAKGKYYAIINPDVILLEGSIDNLYSHLKDNQHIGILVPKLLNSDLSIQYSVRKFINLKILFLRVLTKGDDNYNNKVIDDYLLKNFDTEKVQSVDWALGAAMIIESTWFWSLGGFDDKYFLYLEDEDLCLASWKKGKPVVYYPESQMIHDHQRSSNKSLLNKNKLLHIKSMFRFFLKHDLIRKQISFM